MEVDQKLISRILMLIAFILFVIAAVQSAYGHLDAWMPYGGLAAMALSFLIA